MDLPVRRIKPSIVKNGDILSKRPKPSFFNINLLKVRSYDDTNSWQK
jgi:hypothetical protein